MFRYYDLVYQDSIPVNLAERLGYRKIFTTKEINILDSVPHSSPARFILASKNPSELMKALKSSEIAGLIIPDNEIVRKVFEAARESSVPFFITASDLTVPGRYRPRNIARARMFLSQARCYGADVGIITLSKSKEYVMSSMQLISLSMVIGADEAYARKMVSLLEACDVV